MTASRESEPAPFAGERNRRWWWRPLGQSAAALYLGQLAPFVAGPLTECAHCVGNYLKFFPLIPGILLGHSVMGFLGDWIPALEKLAYHDFWRFVVPGALSLAVILFCATWFTAKLKGRWRRVWWVALALLSAGNALIFGAALRM